jgi:hypothetical protein
MENNEIAELQDQVRELSDRLLAVQGLATALIFALNDMALLPYERLHLQLNSLANELDEKGHAQAAKHLDAIHEHLDGLSLVPGAFHQSPQDAAYNYRLAQALAKVLAAVPNPGPFPHF